MKIAIYGGSFNPPHLGHAEAARTVYEELRPDIFLIVPDNIPPHKEQDENSPTAAQRLELCRLAFADYDRNDDYDGWRQEIACIASKVVLKCRGRHLSCR